MTMSKLNIARILIIIGIIVGLESLYQTFNHIGDPLFTISPDHPSGEYHSWYHALREGVADLSTIVILLVVFFGKPWLRSEATWYLTMIAVVGYYAPFWVGMPFNSELAAPTLEAEVRHIIQAAVPIGALFLTRREFLSASSNEAA